MQLAKSPVGFSNHAPTPKVLKCYPSSSISVTSEKRLHLSEVIEGCRRYKAAAFRIAGMNVS